MEAWERGWNRVARLVSTCTLGADFLLVARYQTTPTGDRAFCPLVSIFLLFALLPTRLVARLVSGDTGGWRRPQGRCCSAIGATKDLHVAGLVIRPTVYFILALTTTSEHSKFTRTQGPDVGSLE